MNKSALIENDCRDAAIWDLIHNNVPSKNGKGKASLLRRKVDGVWIDLSFLFVVVQNVGSLGRLKENRKTTKLAQILGAERAFAANALRKIYEGVFLRIHPGSADSLEHALRSNPEVKATIEASRQRVFQLLDMDELAVGESQAPAQNSLPSLFHRA